MPNPQNLKPPIKKGEVRNPKGINRYTAINERMKELASHYDCDPKKFKKIYISMIATLGMCTKKELKAIMEREDVTLAEKNAIQAYASDNGHKMFVEDMKALLGKDIDITKDDESITIRFIE